jgi:hypothetical protein
VMTITQTTTVMRRMETTSRIEFPNTNGEFPTLVFFPKQRSCL